MTVSLDPSKKLEIDISEAAVCITQDGNVQATSTSAVATRYYQFKDNDTGILPPVVRYISGDNLCYIVERPPFTAKVTIDYANVDTIRESEEYANDYDDYQTSTYDLPIPWTVYLITFQAVEDYYRVGSLYMFFKNNQIFYEDEPLMVPLLPNIELNGSVCVGSRSDFTFPMSEGIAYALNNAINTVWCNNFNLDIYPSYIPPEFFDYADLGEPPEPQDIMPELAYEYYSLFDASDDIVPTLQQIYKAWEGLAMHDVLNISWTPPTNLLSSTVGYLIKNADAQHSLINKDHILNSSDPFFTFMKSIL